jgi:hypothetical protein
MLRKITSKRFTFLGVAGDDWQTPAAFEPAKRDQAS